MDHFTIHCTTCKARLVVKDESVIGDILACPKCHSMVQVVPPPDWKRPGSGDSSPGELQEAPAASKAAAVAAVAKISTDAAPAIKSAVTTPPALPARATPVSAEPAPTADVQPAAPEAGAASAETVAASAPPAAVANTIAARLRQDWMLWSGGLLGGVTLGAVVWMAVWLTTSEATVVAKIPTAEIAAAPGSGEPEVAAAPNAEPIDEPQASDVKAPAEIIPAAATDDGETAAAIEQPPAAEPPPEPVEDDAPREKATPPESEPVADSPRPALKLEPFVPAGAAATAIDPSAVAGPLQSSAAQAPPAADEPPAPVEADPADGAPTDSSPGEPAPLAADQIEQRLGVAFENVAFSNVPLAQFTTFIGDVCGVPVVLDEAVLKAAGKTRKTPIRIERDTATADELLRDVLADHGLAHEVREGKIVVRGNE